MEIILNGEPASVPDGTTVADLIERLALSGKRIALEINEDIVPRSQYGERRLQPGDRLEIVHAIGGG